MDISSANKKRKRDCEATDIPVDAEAAEQLGDPSHISALQDEMTEEYRAQGKRTKLKEQPSATGTLHRHGDTFTIKPLPQEQLSLHQAAKIQHGIQNSGHDLEADSKVTTLSETSTWRLEIQRVIKDKNRDRFTGQKYRPDNGNPLSYHRSSTVFNKYPLIRRRVFEEKDIHIKTAIKIKSPFILDAIRPVMLGARNMLQDRLSASRNSIHEPYVPLFQNRKLLLSALDGEEKDQREHLRLLLNFMKEERPTTWDTLDQLEMGTCTRIAFKDLWLLYPPGRTVYYRTDGYWRACKVESVSVQHVPQLKPLSIRCYSLRLNDPPTRLIPQREVLHILPFSGEQAIDNLEIIPDTHLKHDSELRKSLITRGGSYWEFRKGPAYREYSGAAWPKTEHSDNVKAIIDYTTSSKYGSNTSSTKLSTLVEAAALQPPQQAPAFAFNEPLEDYCDCSLCVEKYAQLSSYPEESSESSQVCVKDPWSRETSSKNSRSDSYPAFLYCPFRVWAYSLNHKTWNTVEIEHLKPVTFEDDPFRKLVMHPRNKEVIDSMVYTYLNHAPFSDIVKEKGRGLIILLHGAPGTGKTLTAECVAAKEKRPLYMITCGDLGTEPDELEKRLQNVFLFAVNWKAILLLDEADVFLQERDLYDLKRNALVSIFLRHLEYYDGLLFLTTNRPGQIDEAFQSRIHITLGLPDLNFEHQADVWDIFIENLDMREEKKKGLYRFVRHGGQGNLRAKLKDADYRMNGRQIRNCMRSATALANKARRDVTKDDISTVVDIGITFRNYMTELNRPSLAESMWQGMGGSSSMREKVKNVAKKAGEKVETMFKGEKG